MGLFIRLVAIFFFFSLSFCDCVYVSLCDFVCLVLFLPFVLGFPLFVCLFLSSISSEPYGWKALGALAGCQT